MEFYPIEIQINYSFLKKIKIYFQKRYNKKIHFPLHFYLWIARYFK